MVWEPIVGNGSELDTLGIHMTQQDQLGTNLISLEVHYTRWKS